MEPTEGTGMSTDFSLRTLGWSEIVNTGSLTDDQILHSDYIYKFGYFAEELKGRPKLTLLRAYSEEAEVTSVKLPPGELICYK